MAQPRKFAPLREIGIQRAWRYAKNAWRLLFSPVTQLFMSIGIFPAQTFASMKKVPILRSIIRFGMRKAGFDSRSAEQVFVEDFDGGLTPPPTRFGKTWFWRRLAERREARRFNTYQPIVDAAGNLDLTHLDGKLFSKPRKVWARFYHYFNYNPQAQKFNTTDLKVQQSWTLYKSNFGLNQHLETYTFEQKTFDSVPAEDRYFRIICGNNTANCSRFFREAAQLTLRHPELKTVVFNHCGVERSSGVAMTQADLVEGLIAQFRELIKVEEERGNKQVAQRQTELNIAATATGVESIKLPPFELKSINVELSGFSIGAATAAIAAKKIKDDYGVEVNLYSDRTFSTMQRVIEKKLNSKRGWIAKLLWLINWNMEPAPAYSEINPERRAATVVDPARDEYGDPVISVDVSLANAERSTAKKQLDKLQFLHRWRSRNEDKESSAGQSVDAEQSENAKLVKELETWEPDNAIEAAALRRMGFKKKDKSVEDKKDDQTREDKKDLTLAAISHLELGVSDRLRGLKKVKPEVSTSHIGKQLTNAHNATVDQLQMYVSSKHTQEAARAAQFAWADASHAASGLEHYSFFHESVVNKNKAERMKAELTREEVSRLQARV